MMSDWKMLSLVGQDKPGIVAKITSALFELGAQLGEASMMRLGGNFTIMLMVKSEQNSDVLEQSIDSIVKQFNLNSSILPIEANLHQHEISNTRITVYCADRLGIVAQATSQLLTAGFNILDLESDVAGNEQEPIYIMHIEGVATNGIESIEQAMQVIKSQGVDIDVTEIDVMIG